MSGRLAWRPRRARLRHHPTVRGGAQHCSSYHTCAAARDPVPSDTRLFVWQRDGGKCCHCGSTSNLQFDHRIPVALGGSNTAANVELLCTDCNLRKGARLFVPGSPSERTKA